MSEPASVCVARAADHWRLHWIPEKNRHVFEYRSETADEPLSGILAISGESNNLLYHWRNGEGLGFLALPDSLDDAVAIRVLIYVSTYNTSTVQLVAADASHLWSTYGEDFWLVHKLSTPNKSYYFQHNPIREDILESGGDLIYEPRSFSLLGTDFDLSVFLGKVIFGGGPANTRTPDSNCIRNDLTMAKLST